MEAHDSQTDIGPPGSIEDKPNFQALLRDARRLEPDRQSALMDMLLSDMLTIPPLEWDFLELNNSPPLKATNATPKEETDFPRIAP